MNLEGKHIFVAGLGESGLAMAKWLIRQGARVCVTDTRQSPPKAEALRAAAPEVELRIGDFSEADTFTGADVVAISPGIPVKTPSVEAARASGIPVVSEIELFAQAIRQVAPLSRVIAITGSNGKTTTTALTACLLNSAGISARACGNIAPSALDALMDALDGKSLPSVWVLELSSFQLETTESLNANASAVLNVTEDHLDRYSGMDEYASVKRSIFRGDGLKVLNRDDCRYADWKALYPSAVSFGTDAPENEDYGIRSGWVVRGNEALIALDKLKITGLHNAANSMAALALCDAIGVPPQKLLAALAEFSGLPHRVEQVADINGVSYYDDSKGTNVGATLAAICGLGRKMAVILGGEGKGQDFSPLCDALASCARAVALIGRDAEIIGAAIRDCRIPVRRCSSLEEAVRWCSVQTRPGDAVLLSPACASFDMFRDYAHRAEVFVSLVRKLKRDSE
ncbi:MAG: UDP-N-acetylmuramoyl-L-alanine--D-glutamate ligase [Candidatus Accumulibacter sp.]|nr:UDP-N-acetylmuramoyl-L-alanine--D-glutamate ligase [Accumulibacter sp.]